MKPVTVGITETSDFAATVTEATMKQVEKLREEAQSLITVPPHTFGGKVVDPITVEKIPGRNDLCSCGSGKKYKKCCL